jgi:O-succinylbenzoic acid--CoA ligase
MTRPLEVVDSHDVEAVIAGVRAALSGEGAAILPHPDPASVRAELPSSVERRIAVVVETSGSTGRPKRVALSADALLASAAASESRLGGPGQWLLALPAHYIAGINVIVRSLASETVPAIMRPGHFDVGAFAQAAAALGAPQRFTSLVPAQLSRLLESDDALEVATRFDRILVGGQAIPQHLAVRALEAGLALTRTYGSSETSGGCLWDGEPIGNTRVRIRGGRVELAGSVLAEGYLGDPDRTAAAFVESDGMRWYRTDDAGEFVDGVLRITGRVDDVIVSGGVKVSLGAVEAAVRAVPGLEGAVVVAGGHDEWGQVAVVASTVAVPLHVVRAAVAERLGREAAPDRILLLDAMPTLATGKPDRLRIAALALQ